MMILRRWIRFIFGFSRRETNGFLVIMPLLVLIIFSRPLYRSFATTDRADFSRDKAELDSLVALLEIGKTPSTDSLITESVPVRLFLFDPNDVEPHDLKTLGLSESVANRVVNYRKKGGKFMIKSDLLKIYGLDSSLYLRLSPYIDLPERKIKNERTTFSQAVKKQAVKKQAVKNRKPEIELFNINTADTTQLVSIYGIGPVFASRITRYRDRLGGFIAKEQLFEVYGLDSMVASRLSQAVYIQDSFVPRKINLNELSEKEISDHPYISKAVAKSIVNYRFQHGSFTDVRDILKIHGIDDAVFSKIEHYLTAE